jgi:transposase
MMGMMPEQRQSEFFSYRIDLERRIRADHPLRQLKATLDLSFVIPLVKDSYGRCGHTSLDPRVIVKLMFLLFYYDVPSERELIAQLPERLDWLWFLDFDLEQETPHHSVLSKARARWGGEVFATLFTRSVEQCVQAGLVDGRLLHADSTIIKAARNWLRLYGKPTKRRNTSSANCRMWWNYRLALRRRPRPHLVPISLRGRQGW